MVERGLHHRVHPQQRARTYFYTEYHQITISPEIFGALGYHLWFVGFLFFFALLALPLFLWLNEDSGKRFVATLARLTKWRGGLLVFVHPPHSDPFHSPTILP